MSQTQDSSSKSLLVISSLLSLLIGFSIAYFSFNAKEVNNLQNNNSDNIPIKKVPMIESTSEHAQKHLDPNYICPMHHEITSTKQGICPICGMDLVPIKKRALSTSSGSNNKSTVTISPEVLNNLSVRLATVKQQDIVRYLDAGGYIETIKAGKQSHLTAPIDGVIKTVIDVTTAAWIAKDTLLYTIESEQLKETQQTYLNALDSNELSQIAKARIQLSKIGFSQKQINQLKDDKTIQQFIDVVAPHAGKINNLKIKQGMLLKSGDDILDISDKSQVQVLANVFQRDSTWLKTGIKAELFLRYSPGESWSGYVTQDTVRSSASTRNISSRLVFELPKGKVKSGTQVRTRIHGETHKDALVIPSESLIYTESEVRVVLALGEGRFQPVEVVIGMESNGYTEVLDGLKKGDKVVSSSQFLIDSESQLISSFKRLQGN